jgi:hypothetical protein
MEAQRFPEDYDGIVAGLPVYSWTGEMAGQAWNVRALQQTTTGALPVQNCNCFNSQSPRCAAELTVWSTIHANVRSIQLPSGALYPLSPHA